MKTRTKDVLTLVFIVLVAIVTIAMFGTVVIPAMRCTAFLFAYFILAILWMAFINEC